MSNNAGQSFELRAIGQDLFFDDQLLAKADDVQNIAQWANYPAMSNVNLNGKTLTDSVAPGNSITLNDVAAPGVLPSVALLSDKTVRAYAPTVALVSPNPDDPEQTPSAILQSISSTIITAQNTVAVTGITNASVRSNAGQNTLEMNVGGNIQVTTPNNINLNGGIIQSTATNSVLLAGANNVVLTSNAGANKIDMNVAAANNGIVLACPTRIFLVTGGGGGASVVVGGMASNNIKIDTPDTVLIDGGNVEITADAGGGTYNFLNMSFGLNKDLTISSSNNVVITGADQSSLSAGRVVISSSGGNNLLNLQNNDDIQLVSQQHDIYMQAQHLVLDIGGQPGLPGQVLTASGGPNSYATWQDIPGLAALQARVAALESQLAALAAN